MPGRPRKPTKVLEMQGTARKDRHGDRQDAEIETGIPDAPKWLSKEAKAEWKHLTADSKYKAALATVDRAMLAVFCQMMGHFISSERPSKKGETVILPLGSAYISTMVGLGAKLGLNPSDRTKLRMPEGDRPKSKWAALKAATPIGA